MLFIYKNQKTDMEKRKSTFMHLVTIVMVLAAIAMGHFTHEVKQQCERFARLEYISDQIHNHGTLCNIEHQGAKLRELK
jgi:hypothetical protein